jgi:hypothetical protein
MSLISINKTKKYINIILIIFCGSCSAGSDSPEAVVSKYIELIKKRDAVSLNKLDAIYCQDLFFIKNSGSPEAITKQELLDLDNKFNERTLSYFKSFNVAQNIEVMGHSNQIFMYPSYDFKVIKVLKKPNPSGLTNYYEVWVELTFNDINTAPKSIKGMIKNMFVTIDVNQYIYQGGKRELKLEGLAISGIDITEKGCTYF